MAKTPEEKLEEELSSLSPEELAEYEAALLQESPEEPEDVSQAEAFGLGAMEGVPFAKDFAAASQAVPFDVSQPFIDSAEAAAQIQQSEDEDNLAGFTERYRKNLDEWNTAINTAEEKHPITFGVGDITGGVTSLAATGSSIPATLVTGALEGVSRSEDRELEDVLTGAGTAMIGRQVGSALGSGLQFIGKKLGVLADKGVAEASGALNKTKTKKLKNHIKKFYTSKKDTSSQSMKRFSDEVLDMKTPDGKPLLETFQSFSDTATKADEIKQSLGSSMGDVLREVDDVIEKVDSEPLYTKLQQEIVEPLTRIQDENAQRLAKKMSDRIDSQFLNKEVVTKNKAILDKEGLIQVVPETEIKTSFKDLKLSELHNLKTFMAKEVRSSFDKNTGQLGREALELKSHVGATTEFIDDVIEQSGVEIPQAKTYKDLKRKWATANLVQEMAEDEAAGRLNGPMAALKQALSVRGIAIGAIQHMAQVPTAVAAGTAIAINEAIASSKTPAVFASGLQKLSRHITQNPDSRHLKRILTASALSSETMREAVGSSIAELNMAASPVPRTLEGAKANKNNLITSLEYHNKQLASELSVAFENDNDEQINAIMDQISKDPSTKGLIQDGIGWDGKVYSEEDKAQLEAEVRRAGLPAAQEIILLEKLNQKNEIPVIEPVQPFQRTFAPRDKGKHPY